MFKKNLCFFILSCLVLFNFFTPPQKLLGQTNRGIGTINLDITKEEISQLIKENECKTSYLQVSKNDKRMDSFYDDYHMSRYLRIKNPNILWFNISYVPEGNIKNEELVFLTDVYPDRYEFKKISKYSFSGETFNISNSDSVSIWINENSSNNKVFMVQFHLKNIERYKESKSQFENNYVDHENLTLGRVRLISNTDIWETPGTSIRLIELEEITPYQSREQSYELVYIDNERAAGVIGYLNTLMRLAPNLDKKIDETSEIPQNNGILRISEFSLDEQRCSYHKEQNYKYHDGRMSKFPFYTWNWNIIKQHIDPNEYYKRYEKEANKEYFINVHNFFKNKVLTSRWDCRRLINEKKIFWTMPFNNNIFEKCNNIFPNEKELNSIYSNNLDLYRDLMYWYSKGFGIPYPIFNIFVYNMTNEEVVITEIIYKLEYIDQYLPAILENPPLSPFIQILNTSVKQEQILPLAEAVAGLSIKPKTSLIFSIMLKSAEGIGHVCKITMKLVVIHEGLKKTVTDNNFTFFTVLNSRRKTSGDINNE